ncbi:MAG: hypothetical protein ACRDRX_26710 [Pseudonocardiaceae bacterium]
MHCHSIGGYIQPCSGQYASLLTRAAASVRDVKLEHLDYVEKSLGISVAKSEAGIRSFTSTAEGTGYMSAQNDHTAGPNARSAFPPGHRAGWPPSGRSSRWQPRVHRACRFRRATAVAGTAIIVASHDRAMLAAISDCLLHLANSKLSEG